MTLRKQVKYNARRCLCNNWGKTVSIVLLSTAIYLLFIIIEMIANILLQLPAGASSSASAGSETWMASFILSIVMATGSFLLIIPLELGITRWYYSLSDGISEDILNIFYCFSNRKMFFRSLWLSLNVGVRILLHGLRYLALPAAGIGFSLWMLRSPTAASSFAGSLALVLSGALFLLFAVFWLIHIQKYFLAKYYLLDGQTTVGKAIRSSVHATRGIRDEIFLFQLSFLGWGLCSLLILPLLYVSAYYSMSDMLYARFLMEDDRRSNSIVPVPNPEDTREVTLEHSEAVQSPEDLSATRPFRCPDEQTPS